MIRRIEKLSLLHRSQSRCVSIRDMAKAHGVYFGLYYWVTNELLVFALTYCLYFDLFGKDLIPNLVDRYSPSWWKVDLHHIKEESWVLFGGRLHISPKLVGDFTLSSVIMSIVTPLQLPVCAATYPWFRRQWTKFFFRNKKF